MFDFGSCGAQAVEGYEEDEGEVPRVDGVDCGGEDCGKDTGDSEGFAGEGADDQEGGRDAGEDEIHGGEGV